MGIFTSNWERQVDNNLFSFIEIDHFKNFKFPALWNYFLMWFLLLLQTAMYGVDVYTCVRLLAFNTWTSQVKPYISFKISKWLFAACIICSIVLLIFEALRGIRVYRTENISLTYTNPFARTVRSIKSYKQFCVLNAINPGGGFEKMAFYTYFTLHSSKKLILADSPRQIINALTLWSVLNIETQFWETLKAISISNRNEALILYGMCISFFIWIFFVAQLFFALVFTIPVYYQILHKLRFQSLRQFVCIKVDKTVKKLARKYQKEALKKRPSGTLNFESFKPNQSFEKMEEKPSIPTLKFKSSESSLPSYHTNPANGQLSKASTFDSLNGIPPLRPYSQLNISQNDLHTIKENQVINEKAEYEPKTIDVPQFRDMTMTKPGQVYQKSLRANLLLRNEEDVDRPNQSKYQLCFDSESSSNSEPFPDRRIFPQRSYSETYNTEFANSKTNLNQSVVSLEGYLDKSDDEFQNQWDDDYIFEDNGDGMYENSLSRKDVRPSLILRAKQMEMEDYSSFKPRDNESMV